MSEPTLTEHTGIKLSLGKVLGAIGTLVVILAGAAFSWAENTHEEIAEAHKDLVVAQKKNAADIAAVVVVTTEQSKNTALILQQMNQNVERINEAAADAKANRESLVESEKTLIRIETKLEDL